MHVDEEVRNENEVKDNLKDEEKTHRKIYLSHEKFYKASTGIVHKYDDSGKNFL